MNYSYSMDYKRKCSFCSIFNSGFVVFILVFLLLFLSNDTFALESLNNDQMIAAQSNGMISAMCYVLDIITGSFGRTIMAVFVMGTGWLFLVGAVKDWKTIFFFTLAITIMFGAAELANIISGNDYSCKKIYAANEIDRNTIYNAGDCRVIDINQYVPGQQWYTCSTYDRNKCEEKITDETVINIGNIVGLKMCEEGSFKRDNNIVLKYECKETTANGEKIGKFELLNGSDLERGKCLSSCNLKSLKQILVGRNAKSSSSKTGAYIILNNSGSFKEGNYFTQDSIVDLDCNAGYIEYNKDGAIDVNGLKAICIGNNIFDLEGSCKSRCRISNTKYKDSVLVWQKYDENTKSWKDTADVDFYYGEKIRIKTCNEHTGYNFITKKDITGKVIPVSNEEKLVLSCGDGGAWNQEMTNGGKIGKVCSKNCSIEKYRYYANNLWKTDCNDSGECQTTIKDGTVFQEGDVVGVEACLDGDYSVFSNKDVRKLRLTCSASGDWIEDEGERCHKKCEVNKITNFEFAESWVTCDERGNGSKINNKVSCESILKKNLPAIVEHGITLKQGACALHYNINVNDATTFICRDGEFSKQSGATNEVCRRSCIFEALKGIDGNGLVWFKSNSSGDKYSGDDENIINIKSEEKTKTANYGDYYTLRSCGNDSMKVFADNPIVVKCSDDGEWVVHKNKENYCYMDCDLKGFDGDVVEWNIYNADINKYKPLTNSTFKVGNGDKVMPTKCREDYSVNPNITSSFYIQCKNEKLTKSKNIQLCYRNCNLSQLNGINIVEEWFNNSTNKILTKDDIITHGTELSVNKCRDGYTLQNRRAVFVCNNGEFVDAKDNYVAGVCLNK